MNLTKLKKKLEPLPTEARETLAAFMATLAQADDKRKRFTPRFTFGPSRAIHQPTQGRTP